jgi:hypothetical protein
MSDYFGALMNLSGVAARPAPMTGQVAAPAPDVVELDVVREVAPAHAAPAAEPRGSVAPRAIPAMPPPIETKGQPQSQPARPAATMPTIVLSPAPTSAVAPAEETRVSSVTPEPISRRLIRAATKWVAADPQVLATLAATEQPARRSDPVPAALQDRVVPPGRERSASSRHEPNATTTTDAAPAPARIIEPPSRVIEAARDVFAEPRAAARSIPTMVQEETVEVSIGAIHVHVDAPPQAVKPAPEMVPVRAPVAAARAGSALARRALRRI